MIKWIGLYLITMTMQFIAKASGSNAWLAPTSLAILLLGATACWLIDRKTGLKISFGKGPIARKRAAIAFASGLLITAAVITVSNLAGWVEFDTNALNTIGLTTILIGTVRVILTAASEEIIFRGFYYTIIKSRTGVSPAVFGSAVLWSLTHLPDMLQSDMHAYQVIIAILTFICWGAVLSLSMEWGGSSLGIPISLHAGINAAFSLMGPFLSLKKSADALITGSSAWFPESGLLGLLTWASLLVFVFIASKFIHIKGKERIS